MDELRDYRFYAKDMIHPSDAALDYIWEKFTCTFFSTETIEIVKEIEKIIKAGKHRPVNPDSDEFVTFKEKVRGQIHKVLKINPDLDLSEELALFA